MKGSSKTEEAERKTSRSSLMALIDRDKMLELSSRGKEKLGEEGFSMATRAERKAISGTSSVTEISEEKMLEHSGAAKKEHSGAAKKVRMEEVPEFLRAKHEKDSCSWVVEMEMTRWNQKCIYRVPDFIKKMSNGDAYLPQFVSLGPLHNGEPHLMPVEEHKHRAVQRLINRAGKPIEEFITAINEVADELMAAYDSDLDEKWRGANKGSFVEMMVTDGCFLLELIRKDEIQLDGRIDDDYAANDPIFSDRSFIDLWPVIRDDMIAMENQLPLVVLQRLLAVQRGNLFPQFVSPLEVNYMVAHLLDVPPCFDEGMDKLGLHFLDIFLKSYCGISPSHCEGSDKHGPRTPCAVEMSEAGIRFKKSDTDSIHDLDFKNGVLSIPLFKLHGSTERILLNLMVYEWLHPDAKRDVRSYISFMDDMVESEKDVAMLRSQGIFENLTGSDKKVVEMFRTLTKLSRVPIRGSRLGHVQWRVNTYCKKRLNRWRATFVSSYLSNPWVFISLVAAIILLIATLLQTVYTILPYYKKV